MYPQMQPLSYHTEATIYFLFFWDRLFVSLSPVNKLMSTTGTRLWMLDKGVTALGDACGCLSFGDSCLLSRVLVSVHPGRLVNLWTLCYQSQKQDFLMLPKSSRHPVDRVLSVFTHRLLPGEVHPFSNHSSSLMRKTCSYLYPLFLHVRLSARKLLEPSCKHPCGTHFPSLLSFSLLFVRAFEWKHFYKVKRIQIYAPFQ